MHQLLPFPQSSALRVSITGLLVVLNNQPCAGATLKQIRDQTSVRVDIPKRDAPAANGNGHANGTANGSLDDDDDEPTIPVTLVGPQPLAYEALAMLKQIISSKASHRTLRVRDIPAHILPFILARRAHFMAAAGEEYVSLTLNQPAREITANGDREAVGRVIDSIKQAIKVFEESVASLKMSLPKRQHRLLTGHTAEAALSKVNCAVVVAANAEEGDEVTVWGGSSSDLPAGLAAVMELANSKYIHEFILPGPAAFSRQLVTYFNVIQYAEVLTSSHPGVDVYLPSLDTKGTTFGIDMVGDKPDVDAVVKQVSEFLGKLIGATRTVTIDQLLHSFVIGRNPKK